MEKYDSSEKHRFKKETILHAESNGSLTLVWCSVDLSWLTVCSKVKKIKQKSGMSNRCLKLVPERLDVSRDFMFFKFSDWTLPFKMYDYPLTFMY